MTTQAETYEDEYEEYDEFDEEDNERGLSGLVVLLMGVVMLGAFASIVWIAYQQGIKSADGSNGETPYVAADPEPLKIENRVAAAEPENDRVVYDRLEGEAAGDVEVLAGPEEPLVRETEDAIEAIAAETQEMADEIAEDPVGEDPVGEDPVADRIATLETAGEAAQDTPPTEETAPAAAGPAPAEATAGPAASTGSADPASGTHLVQVGAFKSQAEADGFWTRLDSKLGDFAAGKGPDVERADLGDKGVFYRLRIGPFASSDSAATYCEGLKSRGQDCLVRAK